MKQIAKRVLVVLLLAGAAGNMCLCNKMEEKKRGIDPAYVAREFFRVWQKKDWASLYRMAHPSFIQQLRMQKLTPEQRRMTDEELFVSEFERIQRMYPEKVLRTYEIKSISSYRRGDTTVWVTAVINGKLKKIPLTLDGLSLKVDLSHIE